MGERRMSNMKLSGVTNTGGGNYENVTIEGVANINGDIKCKDMNIQGVSSFSGDVECEDLLLEGTCKVTGGVRAEKCKLAGLLTIGGGMEAEKLAGSGSFRIDGTLNAGEIDVNFVYGSGAGEVCGQEIRIRKEKASGAAEFVLDFIPWRHKGKHFQADLIEGDVIDINWTKAGVVRGKDIKIGPECEIDLVEYHGSLAADSAAKIKNTVKLGE